MSLIHLKNMWKKILKEMKNSFIKLKNNQYIKNIITSVSKNSDI